MNRYENDPNVWSEYLNQEPKLSVSSSVLRHATKGYEGMSPSRFWIGYETEEAREYVLEIAVRHGIKAKAIKTPFIWAFIQIDDPDISLIESVLPSDKVKDWLVLLK